jgi:hypothetical protein
VEGGPAVIYSRFDESSGLYDVFEDGQGKPVNSDLPIPSLGPPTNGIGVPASESGRPMPAGAKYVGRSWHARGVVLSPGSRASLSGIGDAEQNVAFFALLGLAVLGGFLYYWYDPQTER